MKTPRKKQEPGEEHIQRHRDGSIWARGRQIAGKPVGYWEWFRIDGTRLRSGYFEEGEPVGEWTTYDKKGEIYKVTVKPPRSRSASR